MSKRTPHKSEPPKMWHHRVTMPIRDMYKDGEIVFLVTVYGFTPIDARTIPGGGNPFFKAVERMGLDTTRFQALVWDTPRVGG